MNARTPRRAAVVGLSIAVVAFAAMGLQALRRAEPVVHGPFEPFRPPREVSALAVDGPRIWAGGRDGVVALDRVTGAIVDELRADRPLRYVSSLLLDDDGTLWVGHVAGLTRFRGDETRTLTEEDGLPDRRVNALKRDREGRLWVGTWGGVATLDGDRWSVLTSEDGLLDDMVNVIHQDPSGGLWFGSAVAPRGGVSILTDGRWEHVRPEDGLPHASVSAFATDDQGQIWIGTGLLDRGGAACLGLSDGRWRIVRTLGREDGLPGDKVRSLFADPWGALWFGTEYDGVLRLHGTDGTVYTATDGLSHPEVKVFVLDPDENLWLGTADGVSRLSSPSLVPTTHRGTP
jgi:ligand-binding sensor domain-containing protein